MFQLNYTGITAAQVGPTRVAEYKPSVEGERIRRLAVKLDTSTPNRDSHRLGGADAPLDAGGRVAHRSGCEASAQQPLV